MFEAEQTTTVRALSSSRELSLEGISILTVDDHPVVRFGISELLETAGARIVGEASSSADLWMKLEELEPDVVVLDIELEDGSALAWIRKLLRDNPYSQVVAYSIHVDEWTLTEAFGQGVKGYVCKDSKLERLCEAVRTVAGGGCYVDPAVTSCLVGQLGRVSEKRTTANKQISPRERCVLTGLVSGKPNKEIAGDLSISVHTVKYHLKSLFSKLQVRNRTEAAKLAMTAGLVRHD